MTSILALLVLAAVAWRVMSKELRIKILHAIDVALAVAREHGREDLERSRAARRARGRWPFATVALAALSLAVFAFVPNAHGDPSLGLSWGASFGPLTSNGEWWRLVTAMFVNRGFGMLLVNTAALLQVGFTLEPVTGSALLAAAFVTGGIFSGLGSLSLYPMGAVSGPAGAIWALYGLLLVVAIVLRRRRSDLALPLTAVVRIGAMAVVFAIANLVDAGLGGAQFAGLPVGFVYGLAGALGVAAVATPPRRVGVIGGAALAAAIVCAFSLRGILDVRPEIDRIVSLEHNTSASYQVASEQWRKGRITADALADLIDRGIIPELQAAIGRLDGLHGVPAEDLPRMADAREFLRLRSDSWRLRAEGLRLTAKSVRGAARSGSDSDVSFRQRVQDQYQSTLIAVGKADGAERASLDAFTRLQQQPHDH